jgi:hypothetical protein
MRIFKKLHLKEKVILSPEKLYNYKARFLRTWTPGKEVSHNALE